jgi:hypothetical protein
LCVHGIFGLEISIAQIAMKQLDILHDEKKFV